MNALVLALKVLDTALMVGEYAAEDRTMLEKQVAALKSMIAEGRQPTDAEWAEANRYADDTLAKLAARLAT